MTHVRNTDGQLGFDTAPRIAYLSDLPGSGKTKAMETVGILAHDARMMVDPTPATFAMQANARTVCIDELDVLFGSGQAKSVLRSLLNAGYRKRAATWERANKEPVQIFGAVAFAGLQHKFKTTMALSTLRSRTLCITMVPTTPGESYRPRFHDRLADILRGNLADWCRRNGYRITESLPEVPEGITDRNAELVEPLLAIADCAGGAWPQMARDAVRELLLGQVDGLDAPTLTERLLGDLQVIFAGRDRMATEELLDELLTMPGSPWSELWPHDSGAARELAALLAVVDVGPVKIRLGERSVRGYLAADLAPHWCSAVPDVPAEQLPDAA